MYEGIMQFFEGFTHYKNKNLSIAATFFQEFNFFIAKIKHMFVLI
jgi:hypothetical protein